MFLYPETCSHVRTLRKRVVMQTLIQIQRDDVEHLSCVQHHHAELILPYTQNTQAV